MASFVDKKTSEIYKDILHTSNSNSGIGSSLKQITCGDGDITALFLSNQSLSVMPATDSTDLIRFRDADGNNLLTVDSTNDLVKSGVGQHIVNTQYAEFTIGSTETAGFVINTHHPLCSQSANYAYIPASIPAFGTGTDPATTFTTAEGSGTRASELVPVLWYVPDAISIDAVYGIEGADTATGDTTRMHLFSYTFTSGSTSALTSGTLLAHNHGGDEVGVTNAGSEQVYLTTFTIDSASVAAGDVILAFFRSDSINSDYSASITVKYHLR